MTPRTAFFLQIFQAVFKKKIFIGGGGGGKLPPQNPSRWNPANCTHDEVMKTLSYYLETS